MHKPLDSIQPIIWREDRLHLLDQRRLPNEQVWLDYQQANEVADAITNMVVRGAPAIGITAAFGVVLAAREAWLQQGEAWKQAMDKPLAYLAESRPTAVNLRWAIERMTSVYQDLPDNESPEEILIEQAKMIHNEDIAANHKMGKLGSALIDADSHVLTHCNAGALATGGFGTALGVIRQAYADGNVTQVYADETRPWLQGARLTAWELSQEGIPVTLQADGAAAALMATSKLEWIIVGADRITANGDVANKIGTYMLAILAKYHNVKVMVVAPTSTIDWTLNSGSEIPIEQRPAEEVTTINGVNIAPQGIPALNPAFDVTPASLIDVIVTEAGVVLSPSLESMSIIKGN
ncbi:MAG: S-methyl-5-thioribose-1-phosphate isomerase [Gammaproteobacteria bacterium]|nr:MAG: S-methyl-5-thioribose-1-phosphate isomerase [Gammaproteobacteria bacterium]